MKKWLIINEWVGETIDTGIIPQIASRRHRSFALPSECLHKAENYGKLKTPTREENPWEVDVRDRAG